LESFIGAWILDRIEDKLDVNHAVWGFKRPIHDIVQLFGAISLPSKITIIKYVSVYAVHRSRPAFLKIVMCVYPSSTPVGLRAGIIFWVMTKKTVLLTSISIVLYLDMAIVLSIVVEYGFYKFPLFTLEFKNVFDSVFYAKSRYNYGN